MPVSGLTGAPRPSFRKRIALRAVFARKEIRGLGVILLLGKGFYNDADHFMQRICKNRPILCRHVVVMRKIQRGAKGIDLVFPFPDITVFKIGMIFIAENNAAVCSVKGV